MNKRILIVDDHEEVGFYLKAGLIRAVNRYEVQTACSGEEALAAMAAQPFDLVITDLQMPGIDGLALIQQVRERYSRTSLILMTCHRDREIEAAALRLGACGKLTKPFYRNELLAMVQMACLSQAHLSELSRRFRATGLRHRTREAFLMQQGKKVIRERKPNFSRGRLNRCTSAF